MNPVNVPEPIFTLIDNEYCLMDSATYQHIDKVVDEFARDLQSARMESARMLDSVAEEPAESARMLASAAEEPAEASSVSDVACCAVPLAEHGIDTVANTLASPLPAQRGRKEVRIATPQDEEEAPPSAAGNADRAGSVGQCPAGANVGSAGEEVDSSPLGFRLGKLDEDVDMSPNIAVEPSKIASLDLFEENVVLRKKIEKLEEELQCRTSFGNFAALVPTPARSSCPVGRQVSPVNSAMAKAAASAAVKSRMTISPRLGAGREAPLVIRQYSPKLCLASAPNAASCIRGRSPVTVPAESDPVTSAPSTSPRPSFEPFPSVRSPPAVMGTPDRRATLPGTRAPLSAR